MRFFPAGILIVMSLTALLLSGCAATPAGQPGGPGYAKPGTADETPDIHESLSEIVSRHGFKHEVRSQRDGERELDTILIPIALDSLKRRHESLDAMLQELGQALNRPEYRSLSVLVGISADDAEDLAYMESTIASAAQRRTGLRIKSSLQADAALEISVGHFR